jgi:mycothiol synthase
VVQELLTAVTRAGGRAPLDDETRRELDHPPERAAIVVATPDDGPPVAALYLAPAEGTDPGRFNAALVTPAADPEIVAAIFDAAADYVRGAGGSVLQLWRIDARADAIGSDDELAATAGLERERELWQMRVPLPIAGAPRWPAGISVRPFVPGQDEAAWLAVNRAAFAADPDQGVWTEVELRKRETEPWFDPSGFLLAHRHDGHLAGFCWTKVHPAEPPQEPHALGEIYVIGVAPDHQGTGLGRALVIAGLTSLHDRGLIVGMLFVDAQNTAAIGLYRALGFVTTRIDLAYVRSVT